MNYNRKKFLICILLIVATFCIYSQVQDHDFINLDDNDYVTENPLFQTELTYKKIIQVFTNTHYGGWSPITYLSYMLDYKLYGLNPKGLVFVILNDI